MILKAKGSGNYVGCILQVDNVVGGWWGEGDDMIFVDGEKWPPSYHGTGTEEIFGGGSCPNTEWAGPHAGFFLVSSPEHAGKNAMFRFHVQDPVRFARSIEVTVEHGHANDSGNDYSSVAFWYQGEPHTPFPELPPVGARIPRVPASYGQVQEKTEEIHRRIKEMGGMSGLWKVFSRPKAERILHNFKTMRDSLMEWAFERANLWAERTLSVLGRHAAPPEAAGVRLSRTKGKRRSRAGSS